VDDLTTTKKLKKQKMKNILETLKNETVKNLLTGVVNSTKTTGCRFGGLTYTNQNGETSKYNVIFGINIESLYKSDLRTLESLLPTLKGIDYVACLELVDSIKNSLTNGIGNNDGYTLKGYYTPITPNGEVKLHEDEEGNVFLYIRGYVINKTVITEGEYPHVKSAEKTLVKKKIEKNLKRGKIRTFKINVNQLHKISMNGMTVEIS
jgi:hypothetical protein